MPVMFGSKTPAGEADINASIEDTFHTDFLDSMASRFDSGLKDGIGGDLYSAGTSLWQGAGKAISQDAYKEQFPDMRMPYHEGMTVEQAQSAADREYREDERAARVSAAGRYPISGAIASFGGSLADLPTTALAIGTGGLGEAGVAGLTGTKAVLAAAETTGNFMLRRTAGEMVASGAAGGALFTGATVPLENYLDNQNGRDWTGMQRLEELGMNMAFGAFLNPMFHIAGSGVGRMLTGLKDRPIGDRFNLSPEMNPNDPQQLNIATKGYDSVLGNVVQGMMPDPEAAIAQHVWEEKAKSSASLESMEKSKSQYELTLSDAEAKNLQIHENAFQLEQSAKEEEYGIRKEESPEGLSVDEAHAALTAIETGDMARKPVVDESLSGIPEKSIFQFLKEKGGIKPDDPSAAGELKAMGINSKTRPGLLRKDGMDWDIAREALDEAGYFSGVKDSGTTVSDFLNLMRDTHEGRGKIAAVESEASQAQKFLDHFGLDVDQHLEYKKTQGEQNASAIRTEAQRLRDTAPTDDHMAEMRNNIHEMQQQIQRFPSDARLSELAYRHVDQSFKPDNSSVYSDDHVIDEKYAEQHNAKVDNVQGQIDEMLADRQSRADEHLADFEKIDQDQINRERGIDAAFVCLTRG